MLQLPLHHQARAPARGRNPQAVRRRLWAAALVLGVAALHAWLLSANPLPMGAGLAPTVAQKAPPVTTRMLTVTAPSPISVPTAAATPAPQRQAAVIPASSTLRARAPVITAPSTAPSTAPAPDPFQAEGEDVGREPVVEPASQPPSRPVPVYATRPPPATQLAYRLLRGQREAAAQLRWDSDAAGYTLSLSVDAAPGGTFQGLAATSRGSFDGAGLAPERYVDRRRGNARRAANFQRDSASITYSGQASPADLQPGTQDRVSWMLQLAAVLEANPSLAAPGSRVAMWVAGTRGPPQVWEFEMQTETPGEPQPALPAGVAQTPPPGLLHLRRDASRPYDLQVDAWLDPTRHHLPWRVRLTAPPGDWTSDLLLAPQARP